MQTRFVLALFAGIVIGLSATQWSVLPSAHSQEGKTAAKPASTAELESLQAAAAAFAKAFNAGDAKGIGAQFLDNAEAIDEAGDILEGREQIEARFSETFKEFPKAKIEVELTSLRQLGPDVAVEDGFSTTTLDPEEPGSRSPYTVVHVKRDGKWKIASVRDFPPGETGSTPHDHLQALSWLIGHWVDESADGRVETTCQWSDDKNYLLQDYVVKTPRGELKGSQRIGWDGLRQTIRSWAFDRSGAFTETTWAPVEDGWVLHVEGVTPAGERASATRVIMPISSDAFQIDSTNVIVGGTLMPHSSVRVVRQPPNPAE
ncbi:MAG TPA: SgcJ/EcaC family oxidoreductase [Planctomycetaceae bacterium]|nr:SgcJ/EcaC family oxidoreductase [Planctomycetaceae bacterium]